MPVRAENEGIGPSWLLLLTSLLVCAGCNLGASVDGSANRFEGPPLIDIAAPLPNQTFLAGTTVILQARVEQAGPDLARVAVLLNGALLGEKLNPNETNAAALPLTIDWPSSNPGQFTLSVIAERADGSAAREDVSLEVIPKAGVEQSPTEMPPRADATTAVPARDADAAPVAAEPTETALPTTPPGASKVAGAILQPSNLRMGPGTAHELVGSLTRDTAVTIVAVDPTRAWYRITYAEAGDAWIYADLVEAEADIAGVPVETGPPPPSGDGVNLVVTSVSLAPNTPVCQQATDINVMIENIGNLDSSNVGLMGWQVILLSSGEVIESETAAVAQSLGAGEAAEIPFTDTFSLYYGEEQRLRVMIDSGDLVAETNEADNAGEVVFTLAQGEC